MVVKLDQSDRDFLKCLQRQSPATINHMCIELGVTANAVRQKLDRLRRDGLVEREEVRAKRGRPFHEYRVSALAQRSLGENYGELVSILWQALNGVEDRQVRDQLRNRVEDALVDQYSSGVNPHDALPERVRQLQGILHSSGFDIEDSSEDELPILREANCPYPVLAENDQGICDLEQAVFERILGASLQRTNRCLDGHSCCEFRVHDMAGRDD